MTFQGNHVCSGYLLLHKTLFQNLRVEKRNKQKQIHNIPIASGFTWSILLLVSSKLTDVTAAICSVSLVFINMPSGWDGKARIVQGRPETHDGCIHVSDSSDGIVGPAEGWPGVSLSSHCLSSKADETLYTEVADSKMVNVGVNGIPRG